MAFNILFTSVGRRVALIECFRAALHSLSLEGKLVGVDMSRMAPAMHVMDHAYQVPPVSSKEYISKLLDICQRENVRLLVPLIDLELSVLSQHSESFREIGTTVLVSDPTTIEIASDKRKTLEFFLSQGLETPRVFDVTGSATLSDLPYPLILKPAMGSSAMDVTRIDNRRTLEFYRDRLHSPMLQEYVQGQEFTLDILVDFHGQVRCVVPRKRMEVRAGEVSKAVTVRDHLIINMGKRVAEALPGALGPITVQGFLTEDRRFKLIEINARFGGGHPLSIRAGADFPRWIIEMMMDAPGSIDSDGWRSGLVMLRYDEAIFLDEQDVL